VAKLRSLKNKEEVMAFVKGEKRVSVTKLIPGVLNKLS
jgi:hypothetical protein